MMMTAHKCLLAVMAALVVVHVEGGINVVNTSPPDGTIVKEGHTVRLSCRTDVK